MTSLLFQRRFVAPIQAGAKCQTIRPPRKRPLKIGDKLSLRYWSDKPYRSPQVEFANVILDFTARICVATDGILIGDPGTDLYHGVKSLDGFARNDGFGSWDEMREFFQSRFGYGLPFDGVLYQWSEVGTIRRATPLRGVG